MGVSNPHVPWSGLLVQTLRKPEDPYLIGNGWGVRERTEPTEGWLATRRAGPAGRMDGRWAVNRCSLSQGSMEALGVLLFVGLFVRFNFFYLLSKITCKLVKKSNVTTSVSSKQQSLIPLILSPETSNVFELFYCFFSKYASIFPNTYNIMLNLVAIDFFPW